MDSAEIPEDEPVLSSDEWFATWSARDEYSRYSLGEWMVEEREPRGRTHVFRPKVNIEPEEFEDYYEATIPYRRMTERRSYQLLRQASRRLSQIVQLHTNLQRHGSEVHRYLDGHNTVLSISGAVTDWLSWSYIYLGTEESFWKRTGTDEFAVFKRATHDAYDTYPAYRLLYQLRHYAHHIGPPLASLDVTSTDGDPRVDIMIDKRHLLGGGFEWNERSREVLDRLPERFPVMPLITEAMQGYRLIERRLLGLYLGYVESWLDVATEMVERIGATEGTPCLLVVPPDTTKSMLAMGHIGVQPIMTRANIDHVRRILEQPDPIDAVWIDHPPAIGFVADNDSTLKATAVMAAFFQGDAPAARQQIQDVLIADDGNPQPLIAGLVTQNAVTLNMLSRLLGRSPEDLMNTDWTEGD